MTERCPYCGGYMRWSRYFGMPICFLWEHAARQIRGFNR